MHETSRAKRDNVNCPEMRPKCARLRTGGGRWWANKYAPGNGSLWSLGRKGRPGRGSLCRIRQDGHGDRCNPTIRMLGVPMADAFYRRALSRSRVVSGIVTIISIGILVVSPRLFVVSPTQNWVIISIAIAGFVSLVASTIIERIFSPTDRGRSPKSARQDRGFR